jgi:hypothetical protein
MYSAQPDSFELLLRRAQDTVDMRSKHIVEDAITYARWLLGDGREALANLTRCQTRCTELLEETRMLRKQLDELQSR